MKLTEKSVAMASLSLGRDEIICFDDDLPGFGVRLRSSGSRTYIFQFKVGSQHRRITLGRVNAISLKKARSMASDLYAQVRLGRDPASEKAESKERATETFENACRPFLVRQRRRLRAKSITQLERYLLEHAKPLHGMRLTQIDRRAIATLLTGIAEKSGPYAADLCRAALSSFFAWCMTQGLADSNPVVGTVKQGRGEARSRVLNDEELREVWLAAGDDEYGAIVKLLVLTGCRREEIASLRWPEIVDGTISLPPERTKNKRPHVIPLAPAGLAILRGRMRRLGRDLVFGQGSGGFANWVPAKKALEVRVLAARRDADVRAKPMTPWRLHDVRRTVATRMADIGVAPHVVEAVLNHHSGSRGGIAGVYNRSLYAAEVRDALERWSAHVQALVSEERRTLRA
jgi:integrase